MRIIVRAHCLAVLSLFSAGAAMAAENPLAEAMRSMKGFSPGAATAAENPLADAVRAANGRYKDVAIVVADGYAPIPCASGIAGGSMGVHYVNGAYLKDGVVDVAKPEAVMYEPTADGKMAQIAVEYISLEGPASLKGHLFSFSGAPNRYGLPAFYELHSGPGRRTTPARSRT